MKNKLFLMISVKVAVNLLDWGVGTSMEVVQLPEEPSMDDSSSSTEKFENKDNWPDVEELVNQRGDETIYLLIKSKQLLVDQGLRGMDITKAALLRLRIIKLRLQYNGKMQVFERTKTWLLAKNIYNLY